MDTCCMNVLKWYVECKHEAEVIWSLENIQNVALEFARRCSETWDVWEKSAIFGMPRFSLVKHQQKYPDGRCGARQWY
jgi:hypothetical protein